MNENPSLCIESAGSKTSNNGPLKNGSAVSIAQLYVGSKIVCFYESDHAFKTIWRRPCSCHLIKINSYFFQPGRPVFIIVINTSCSGVYPATNALTHSIYYYNISSGPVDSTLRWIRRFSLKLGKMTFFGL